MIPQWRKILGVNTVDLHMHSTASDGSLSPTELVGQVKLAGLSAMALTDHDTIGGCVEAAAAAAAAGIDFIPGIEISCEFPRPGTMHLLGYGVDIHSPILHELTRRLISGRTERNTRILGLLQGAGIDVTEQELLAQADGGTVGRPHLAAILVRKGFVKSVQEAFNLYLGQGGKFYIDKETTTSRQAIEMIHASGGIAVLAHPIQLRTENDAQLMTVIKSLADQGLDGIEVIHSDHNDAYIEKLEAIARKMGLLATGGSDFHGSSKPSISLGRAGGGRGNEQGAGRRIPRAVYEAVVARIKQRQA